MEGRTGDKPAGPQPGNQGQGDGDGDEETKAQAAALREHIRRLKALADPQGFLAPTLAEFQSKLQGLEAQLLANKPLSKKALAAENELNRAAKAEARAIEATQTLQAKLTDL